MCIIPAERNKRLKYAFRMSERNVNAKKKH